MDKLIHGKEGKTFIYAIKDHNGNIVYIGKSNKPIIRFRQHKTWARHPKLVHQFKLMWLKDILDKGIPTLVILKEVSRSKWEIWEKYYINYFKENGNILYNISIGGHESSDKLIKAFSDANELRKIPILQCDLNGIPLMEWESTCLAATTLKIKRQGITRCLKKRRPTANGFIWKYK